MRRVSAKLIWVCGLILAPCHAMDAATSAYLVARDNAVAELASVESSLPDAELVRRDSAARQKLGRMMDGIIGPIHLDGFPTKGEYNVGTLLQGLGFGMLDGVAVRSRDGQTLAVVTTEPLLRLWLTSNNSVFQRPASSDVTSIAEAFASGEFYTNSMSDSDAAFNKYAELPVEQRKGEARAILFVPSQDYPAPAVPEGILVAVMLREKVVLFEKALTSPDISECLAAYESDSKRANELDAADRAASLSRRADAPSVDREELVSNAFIRCYAERLPSTAAYPDLIRQAQALVDLVK